MIFSMNYLFLTLQFVAAFAIFRISNEWNDQIETGIVFFMTTTKKKKSIDDWRKISLHEKKIE